MECNMYETIRTAIICNLATILNAEQGKEVIKIIDRIMVDYDVTRKETAIVVRDTSLEESMKMYYMCRKMEGVAEGTLINIVHTLRPFAEVVGKPLKEITTNDIRAYLVRYQLNRNIKQSSLDKIRQRLHTYFEWCVQEGYINFNPCNRIQKYAKDESHREALSEEELERCRLACVNERDRAMLEIFFSTGARISEIARLTRSDINWYDGSIEVFGKGSSYYTVYLNAKAKVALQDYLDKRKDSCQALFVTARGGKPLSKHGIRTKIEEIGERARLETVLSPHVLRHTMATTALRHGAPLEVVQHMLNHKSPNTTQIYAKMSQSRVAEEHKRTVI